MSREQLCLMLVAAACCLAGCAELSKSGFGRRKVVVPTRANPVVEIVCLWEPGEGVGIDNGPARGFVGQLLFMTSAEPEPARVDGDIRIYLFDDQGTIEEQGKPIHQFDFSAEAWNRYLRETNIGAGYQIFVPYTRPGGYQAKCTLRVRYTPADGGPPVFSRMTTVSLPGRRRPENGAGQSAAAATQDPGVSASKALEKRRAEFGMSLSSGGGRETRADLDVLSAKLAELGRKVNSEPVEQAPVDSAVEPSAIDPDEEDEASPAPRFRLIQ